jgi:uncharacterized protein
VKPAEVIGREAEWSALETFAVTREPLGGVGLLYGRRRTGKSFLLRQLVRAVGGFYFQATESERTDALTEFGGAVAAAEAERTGRSAEPIRYADWNDALSRRDGLVVIDELPYLLRHSPELPSVLQRLADEATNGARPPVRFVLCGSSLSVMTSLLRGQEPLRGRASLDLLLRPMSHDSIAALWGIEDLDVAIRIDAIFGGAPGYRSLTTGVPTSAEDLGRWLSTNVLNPTHALYREDDYLLQEERTITDRALYGSLLRAIAAGVATQSEMAGRLGRSRESLTHPLSTLMKAGFVRRLEDILTGGRPEHVLADPIIRFIRLVVDPARPLLDEYRWIDVWNRAAHQMDANVYGPHLEDVARRWALLGYQPQNGFVTRVGSSKVADPVKRTSMQIDVVAVGDAGDGSDAIKLIGEVKWSPSGFAPGAVDRLRRTRDLLAATGHNVDDCDLALISRQSPRKVDGVRMVDLADLYAR